MDAFGRLDIWVNNAGVNAIGPAAEMDPADWRRVIDTNLIGAFFGSQAAARVMLPQRSGVIIQVGSIFGEVGLATRAPYAVAVFLASDDAVFLTGTSVTVDGGWTAHGGWRL